MNIGPIEIDYKELEVAAMKAVLEIAHKHIRSTLCDVWPRESPKRKLIISLVDSVVEQAIESPEFRAKVEAACKEEYIARAKEKIANAVARTSVSKLKGEA